MHGDGHDRVVIRTFAPGAERFGVVRASADEAVAELARIHRHGLFEGRIDHAGGMFPYRLRITAGGDERTIDDPYRFPPIELMRIVFGAQTVKPTPATPNSG